MRCLLAILALTSALTLSACEVAPVKPWEREHLASPSMAWEPQGQRQGYQQHIDVSKEAASGGGGLSGNACGCN